MSEGYIVIIDWSQTDQTRVFVEDAKSLEEAIETVKRSGCNCPRLYGGGEVDRVIKSK